jgi:hypothetical protein
MEGGSADSEPAAGANREQSVRDGGNTKRLAASATAYPRGVGKWRDDDNAGALVTDEPTVVTSYANPADVTDAALAELRTFLHRLGRETNQGEVGIVVDGAYYPITQYDRL